MPKPPVDEIQAEFCAERLKALGDPLRLRIIDFLRQQGELAVGDLAEVLESEIATVSHHLKILKHARLVKPRREGRFIYYSLAPELLVNKPGTLNLGCCSIEIPK